jgi:glutamyl-tRNA synthetase
VDDIEMGMTHVIRGEDHLSNTWKHIDLFRAFGKPEPRYGHIPLILNPDGSKMSKSDKGALVGDYQKEGFLPEAVFNYLCLLGWTPRSEKEKLNSEEILQLFDAEEIHKSNAKFDMVKCLWFNAQYLRELSPQALFARAKPFLEDHGLNCVNEELTTRAVYSVREKVSRLAEIPEWIHYFFRENYTYEPEVMAKLKERSTTVQHLSAVAEDFTKLAEWNEESIQSSIESTAARLGIKAGSLMPQLRFALTGQARGPGVSTIVDIVGKASSLARLQRTVALL